MAYSTAWDETQPLGSVAASDIDQLFRDAKKDTRERVAGIFGLSLGQWAADPIAPISLTLSGALVAATLAGALTGNVTGNLTGTILTAAQGNITSLGTLTSLIVSGLLTVGASPGSVSGSFDRALIQGNDATANDLNLAGPATSQVRIFFSKPGAPGRGDIRYNMATDQMTVVVNGGTAAVFTQTGTQATILTAAQPNITSLGTLNDISISSHIVLGAAVTVHKYMQISNTGNTSFVGVEASGGGALFTGAGAYSTVLGTSSARSLHLATNNTVRQTIDSAGNVVFTGTVTAANFVGPTSIDANNLTGTTLAANVVNSSLTSVGTLTGLTVSGTSTFGASTDKVIINRLSDSTSYGSITFNGVVTTPGMLGIFGRSNPGESLYFAAPTGYNFVFYVNGATVSTISSTGVYNGNLTGTILTAAQGNITSLGTLTSLIVSGTITGNTGFSIQKNGSDTIAAGPYIQLVNVGSTLGYITQLSASGHYDFWRFNGGWAQIARFTQTDQFLVGTTSIAGVAAGGIHVAGASVFDSTLVITGNLTQAGASIFFDNDTAALRLRSTAGVEKATFRLSGNDAYFETSGTERMRFVAAGGTTFTGTATFNSTVSGITTLTATTLIGNLTGTINTSAQGNITSLGTLTSLTVSGSVTITPSWIFTTSGSDSVLIPNTNSILFRNNANNASNLILTDAGAGTFRAGVTATVFTGPLTGNVTGNITGTVLTAAQGNITSLGTLTGLTVNGTTTHGGNIVFSAGSTYDIGDTTNKVRDLYIAGDIKGLGPFSLGDQSGAVCVLAKLGTGDPLGASVNQNKWLRIIGSDAVNYYIPAWI